jgi:hypothetical protein
MSNGTNSIMPCQIKAKIVVTMVGLPFRGKSLAAHKISRNLFWKGEDARGMCENIKKSFFENLVENFSKLKIFFKIEIVPPLTSRTTL